MNSFEDLRLEREAVRAAGDEAHEAMLESVKADVEKFKALIAAMKKDDEE